MKDKNDTALTERLTELCNYPHFTSYAVRLYIGSNSIQKLDSSTSTLLLEEAFVFHFFQALQGVEIDPQGTSFVTEQRTTTAWTEYEKKEIQKDSDTIFRRGLARRQGTSAALKYLSCCGSTCLLDSSRGLGFENLVAHHLSRMLELQGKSVVRMELKGAWPGPSGPGRITKERLNELESLLRLLWHKEDTERINQTLKKENGCIIFRQGYPMAQGPDLFVAFVEENKLLVYLVQCKHYQSMPTFKRTKKWWSSLGVHVTGDQNNKAKFEFQPTTPFPAAWSNLGINVFCKLLLGCCNKEEASELDIRKRVMATSAPLGIMRANIPLPPGCDFLSNEMLQPTFSVFEVPFQHEDDKEENMYGFEDQE